MRGLGIDAIVIKSEIYNHYIIIQDSRQIRLDNYKVSKSILDKYLS